MPYPSPPWTLKGYAFQTLQFVDCDRIRPFIPPEFEIFSVGFGKTIGGIYISTYQADSTLQYNELIVSPAMVTYNGKWGGWITHIYVDNPDSVAGGREIWGLPKELATFNWEGGNSRDSSYQHSITISQGSKQLCSLNYKTANFSFPVNLSLPCFGLLGSNVLQFQASFQSDVSLISGNVNISDDSPFASFGLDHQNLTLSLNALQVTTHIPNTVGTIQGTRPTYP